MLIAGIVDKDEKKATAGLINSIFSPLGKKVSIVDVKNLVELDRKTVKKYVSELDNNNIDILILHMNILDVEKEIFDFIHFDVIIYKDKAEYLKGSDSKTYLRLVKRLFSLLDEKAIAIVNVDDSELVAALEEIKKNVVTYGFSSKASITASSIGDDVFKDNFLCCLKRAIPTKSGILVEPQEYSIKAPANDLDVYQVMAAASFAIINGVDLNTLNFDS